MLKTLAIVAMCFGSVAMAGNQGNQTISFDDMRTACLNPGYFHNQIAPTNIQVSCRDVQTKWIPDEGAQASLDTGRQVTTSVYSDKYTVGATIGTVPSNEQVIGCPVFKQVTETVETIRNVTCDELVKFQGDATAFCANTVNSLRSANPAAITVTGTGQIADFCGATQVRPKK